MPENWVQRPVVNTEEGSNPGAPLAWGSPENPDDAVAGYGYVPCDTSEVEETFYYHSDHLGSTAYITDQKANVTQYDAYLPYGELLVDEHSSSTEMPYKFNGKELDEETGLYYYGARYMNPVTSMWYGVDQLAEKYVMSGSYVYCLGNPVKLFDPDGKKGILVHGTRSQNTTWKDQKGINMAIGKFFNDKGINDSFNWSGGNFRYYRSKAAGELINHIKDQINSGEIAPDEPITLIGHSHGGNVIIEASNMMMKMPEFEGRQINILTINTPVRSDYQLSEKAKNRVTHVNVYDSLDPIQENGGMEFTVDVPVIGISTHMPFGEYGHAERKFPNALNIAVDSPQFFGGDYHNSHNRVFSWLYKADLENFSVTPNGPLFEYNPFIFKNEK